MRTNLFCFSFARGWCGIIDPRNEAERTGRECDQLTRKSQQVQLYKFTMFARVDCTGRLQTPLTNCSLQSLSGPRTSIRGHVRRVVGRLVGWLATQMFKTLKTAKYVVFLHYYRFSCLTTLIFILLFVDSFIHSFIYSFKTFIHKFLIKRGALIGHNLALFFKLSSLAITKSCL